jgi:hypothetical protein
MEFLDLSNTSKGYSSLKNKVCIYCVIISGVIGLFTLQSCESKGAEETSTFQLIQTRILNTSCAVGGCHRSAGDASFVQHGLVLEASVAYKNLVNAIPVNENARADGLLRVKPYSADKSLLFHKLHVNDDHHISDYGLSMPLGLDWLPEGKVEFIRRWIEAGAPQTGSVVEDVALLDDDSPQPENFNH